MKTFDEKTTGEKKIRRVSTVRVLGYITAALMALQPFLEVKITAHDRVELLRLFMRIVLSVLIAVFSRYLKDREIFEQQGKESS